MGYVLFKEGSLSPVNQYKNWEKNMARGVKKGALGFTSRFAEFVSRVFRTGRQHFTIMLIPHSEKKIFNFKVSIFALIFYSAILSGVTIGFVSMAALFGGLQSESLEKAAQAQLAQAKLDIYGEEINSLNQVTQLHETAFSGLLDIIGTPQTKGTLDGDARGDLTSFLNVQQLKQGVSREVGSLVRLRSYLEQSLAPLGDVTNVLNSQKKLLVDIPTLWPLKGVRGRITSYHGASENPFTGAWYFHKGIDIAQSVGTPIIAPANGKVNRVEFDANGYGNYIDLTHPYGFSTRFGHLSRVLVSKGQEVLRGQLIGNMGSTGYSTGPHLHYEVHLGVQYVDPLEYLNISSAVIDQGAGADGRGYE